MTERPTQFGRIHAPDEAWLGRNPPEPILEPELPIIDTHHHLWDREGHRYFVPDFLADARTGHNLVATVFLECHSMYRAKGPEAMRPVGETEFVAGQAAMSDSGMYGPTRVAAGIVGFADLTLGDRVEDVFLISGDALRDSKTVLQLEQELLNELSLPEAAPARETALR